MSRSTAVVQGAVEGLVDEAVARRLVAELGGSPGTVYGKNGKQDLRQKLPGYNNAARFAPWLVLVDLDDTECAPPLVASWLPAPAPLMCFRVAVREVEAWLLADRERFARFLGVRRAEVPRQPDDLDDPKALVVGLARRSRRRDVREDMVPRPRGGRAEGPAYASRLIEFATGSWRPNEAAAASDSLRRCLDRLELLIRGVVA